MKQRGLTQLFVREAIRRSQIAFDQRVSAATGPVYDGQLRAHISAIDEAIAALQRAEARRRLWLNRDLEAFAAHLAATA